MPSKLPTISLFTGAGGLDLGAAAAGCRTAIAVEVDHDCVNTLRLNREFRSTTVLNSDISEISGEELLGQAGLRRGEVALLIGGPPCQPFSKAAYWTSTGEEARRREQLRDAAAGQNGTIRRRASPVTGRPRNPGADPRASLIKEYLRVLQQVEPEAFVFENVVSMTHPTSRPMFEWFLRACRRSGYAIEYSCLNAAEYGVAQLRNRLFVVGLRGKHGPSLPAPSHSVEPSGNALKPAITAGQVLSRFASVDFQEPDETIQGRWAAHLREIPPGWNYKALSAWAGHPNPVFEAESRYWHFLLKLHPDKPSWTIAASPGPWTGPFHWESRRLRVPELSSLQGFPETYRFFGSKRSVRRQIGNAVPPSLAEKVIRMVTAEVAGIRSHTLRKSRTK